MIIDSKLFMEIASRGVSQKTWDKMNSVQRTEYLKANPTSRYADPNKTLPTQIKPIKRDINKEISNSENALYDLLQGMKRLDKWYDDVQRLETEDEGNGYRISFGIRGWGSYDNDEDDNDFCELDYESREKLDDLVDDINKKYGVDIQTDYGEKKWITADIYIPKKQEESIIDTISPVKKKRIKKTYKVTPEIKEALNNLVNGSWTINENGEVDIDGGIDSINPLFNKALLDENGELKIKFGEVSGEFSLYRNPEITSLEGCPRSVGGYFSCTGCIKLKDLKGAPKKVYGNFDCFDCIRLESLKGAPEFVGKCFNIDNCKNLKSLEGAPKTVKDTFHCANCINLKSLKGCPSSYNFYCNGCKSLKTLDGIPNDYYGEFSCSDCDGLKKLNISHLSVKNFSCSGCNELKTLEGCPSEVRENFFCCNCKNLKSLKGCPKRLKGYFDCSDCKSLMSLNGCPEYVGDTFSCINCGKTFVKYGDIKEVTKRCFVKYWIQIDKHTCVSRNEWK